MKDEKLFLDTLEELKIKNIHVANFTPEQIFYQIQSAVEVRVLEMQVSINKQYAKYLAEKKEKNTRKDSESSDISSEEEISEPEEVSEEMGSSGQESGMESDGEDSASEYSEHSSEMVYSSEEAVDFESDMWLGSHSSDDEIVNLPAHEVLKILKDPKGKRK